MQCLEVVSFLQRLIDSLSYYRQNVSRWVRDMVVNAIFNNISVISWRSVLFVDETEVHGKNCRK